MARVLINNLITSIDVGTTKICVLIAQKLPDGFVEIIGVGRSPSHGLRKGVVVDVAKTIHSIGNAIKEAEMMAGIPVESAYIGIAGAHIQSINSNGMAAIKRREIRRSDVMNTLDAAKAISIPEGQKILHVLPQYFVIDGKEKIHDPIGMHGIRLEVYAHVIMGSVASVQDLITCCEHANIRVNDIILEQLASADAVLSQDERTLGVAVLDIGGGTSDLALYQNGSVRHTMVLPVAGNHFTNDLAIGLRITLNEAERVKKEYGLACSQVLEHDELIEVEMVHGRDIQVVRLSDLIQIIEPRAEELFTLVNEEIVSRNLKPFMTTGMVLTGGGSLLAGLKELAEHTFNCSVRIGYPRIVFDLPETLRSPIFATSYGLLLHVLNKEQKKLMNIINASSAKRIFEQMKSWVLDFF